MRMYHLQMLKMNNKDKLLYNPLYNHIPTLPESFKNPLSREPTTPTVTSNAFINDTEEIILKKNPPYKVPNSKVSLYNKLPEDFIKAIRNHSRPVTIGKGGARRRTKYKRAKKRSLKSRKKSKV